MRSTLASTGLLGLAILIGSCQTNSTSSDVLSIALSAGDDKSPFAHGFSAMSPYDSSGIGFWAKALQPATGLPDSLLAATLYTDNLQSEQHIYYGFKAGLMDSARYEGYMENGFIDEDLYTTEFVDQQIHIVVGKTADSSHVIIYDTDNDEDLSDEQAFVVSKDPSSTHWVAIEDALPEVEVSYELFDGSTIREATARIAVNPYIQLPPGMPDLAFVGGRGYQTGYIDYKGQRYAWWVADASSKGAFTRMGTRIWFEPIELDEEIKRPKEQYRLLSEAKANVLEEDIEWPEGNFPAIEEPYEMGDLLSLGGDYFTLEAIDPKGEYLTLKPAEANNVGLRKGLAAPDFEAITLDNSVVRLSDYRGKYVLIDFWGTWCGPCITEVPYLVDAYDSYSRDDFEILAVANDSPDLVRDFVEKEGLEWVQVVQEEGDPDTMSVLELYRIRGYPTTYLLDRDGIIVERESKLRGSDLEKTLASFLTAIN